MAKGGNELATAYLALVPSLDGAKREIESQLSGMSLKDVGKSLGASLTSGMTESMGSISDILSEAGSFFESTFGAVFSKVSKIGIGAVTGIATAIAGLAVNGGLARVLNIEKAKTMFKGLKLEWSDFENSINKAVDGTAFSMDAAALVAANLAASGVKAGNDIDIALRGAVGTAATFGSELGDIGGIYQKVAAQGKVSGETLQQFADRGVNVTSVLMQALGKTSEEIKEMVKDGEISFKTFSDAMNAAFGDGAQAANETFTGSMANMRSALNRIGADFMEPFRANSIPVFNAVRLALNAVRSTLAPLADKFGEIAELVSGKVVSGFDIATSVVNRFSANLSAGDSVLTAMYNALTETFGQDTISRIIDVAKVVSSAVGALVALGPTLKIASVGVSVMSKACDGLSAIKDKLAPVTSAVSRVISSIGEFTSRLGGSSLTAIQAFGKSLLYGLVPQGVFDKIADISKSFGYLKIGVKNELKNAAEETKAAIKGWFSGIGNSIGSSFGGVPGKIAGAFSHVKSVIGESVGNAADAFRAKFNIGPRAERESSIISAAFGKIKSAANGLAGPLMSATGGLAAVAGSLMLAGVGAVAAGVDVKAACDQFLANIQNLTVNLPVMAEQFAGLLPDFVDKLVVAIPALVEAFIVALDALLGVFPIVLPKLIEGLTSLVVQLAPVIVSMMPLLLEAGIQLFTALLDSMSQVLPALIAMLPEMVQQIATVLIDNMPLLLSAAITLFTAIVTAFVEMLPELIGKLPELATRVMDGLIAYAPQLGAAALTLFTAIVESVPKILGALLEAVGSLLSNIPGKIVEFAGAMGTAAKDMLLGMISGIQNAAGEVWAAITRVCSGALDAVKTFFGIASPSKVMRKMFRYVGEGAALGIEDTASDVVSSMDRMVEDATRSAERLHPELTVGAGSSTGPIAASAGVDGGPFVIRIENCSFNVREDEDVNRIAEEVSEKIYTDMFRKMGGLPYAA